MLIAFSVENFLSFKEMVTLSMEASVDSSLPQNIIDSAQGTDFRLLKSAALYGPNASGKSNLIKALYFMRKLVLTSAEKGHKGVQIDVTPFKLDRAWQNKPSAFEIEFLAEGTRYLYGFSVDKNRVHEEWLYTYPYKRPRLLFERNDDGYKFGASWKGEAKRLAGLTRDAALFISVADQFNHAQAGLVVNWFTEKLHGVLPLPIGESEEFFTIHKIKEEPEAKTKVLNMLKNADLDITGLDVEFRTVEEAISKGRFPPEFLENIPEDMKEEFGKAQIPEVTTQRTGVDENKNKTLVSFEMDDEESDGTQKYFILAGPLIHVLENGCCLLADELDVRLHPLLTRGIVEMFHNEKNNPKGAQLLFATHDVNLLDQKNLLRRDQIWFTDKGQNGATRLYSAWDYKVRKEESFRKGYLAGRYGAVPFVEELIDTSQDEQSSFSWK